MQLDLSTFLMADFAGRIAIANRARGGRLWSPQLAELWTEVAVRLDLAGMLDRPPGRALLRELIALAPDSPAAEKAFRRWIGDASVSADPGAAVGSPPRNADSIVHLIVSCDKYKARAMALYESLAERLRPRFILLGGGIMPEAVFEGPFLTVPAPDNYEGLTWKMLEGFVAVRRRFGRVGVLKIDDDAAVVGPSRPDRIAALSEAAQYAGQVVGGADFDRCWHAGKCERLSDAPYRGRYHGSWAGGPLYYIGPRALDLLVREYIFFPGEFDGEHYEDKAVADALRRLGVLPQEFALADAFGLDVASETPPPVGPLTLTGGPDTNSSLPPAGCRERGAA
jgi:hypothetical protein